MAIDAPSYSQHVPPLGPHYAGYTGLLRKLYSLIRTGDGESDQADAIREAMDSHWTNLSREEAALARLLSADLNTIGREDAADTGGPDEERQARLAVESARSAGDWKRVSQSLREHIDVIPKARAAMLRWECWENLGDPESALLFLEESRRIGRGVSTKPGVEDQ